MAQPESAGNIISFRVKWIVRICFVPAAYPATTPNAALPEVAGDAAIYVKPMDEAALAQALTHIQQPDLRMSLIARGRAQARLFSWTKMAKIVERVFVEAAVA